MRRDAASTLGGATSFAMDDKILSRPLSREVVDRLHQRLEELGRISDESGQLTRTFFSPAMGRVHRRFEEWGAEIGLTVTIDGFDNLRMRWISDGLAPGTRATKARQVLVLGSHLDTVRNAGRYDGTMGVLLALACIEQLLRWGEHLPIDIEVVGFSDEEGLRFQTAYLGSLYYAGLLPHAWLEMTDGHGHTLRQVVEARGVPAEVILAQQRPPDGLLGYLEVHLEQGPRLEAEGKAVGVVSSIAAQVRMRLCFQGKAGHAGTTPMHLRRDALCAAAESILLIEDKARAVPGLVATVGQISVIPGASNVIPDRAIHSLDIRHESGACLAGVLGVLETGLQTMASRRGVGLQMEIVQQGDASPMDSELIERFKQSAMRRQGSTPVLPSGAGHDAVVMARIGPTGMLFVRCRHGLSHHPDEYVSPEDMEMGLAVLADTVGEISAMARRPPEQPIS